MDVYNLYLGGTPRCVAAAAAAADDDIDIVWC
jgi:hypothetical protein